MDLRKFSGKRICVAISGGADSVALLHDLKTHSVGFGYSLCAVHCEHGIRGEASLEDMRFVQELCERQGVELFVFQEDCPARAKREKESLETAARHFRYECFARLIAEKKADYIATAHHQGDEAETVLFRIARGTSLSGAAGIAEENGYLLRPLLDWTKGEILSYVEKNGLQFCQDETNTDVAYTRNKIRLEVLPKLEECVSGAAENIVRFARRAAQDDELLYEYAKELLIEERNEEGTAFTVAFSEKFPLFSRASLLALKGLGIEKDYTAAHLLQAFALQKSERGARTDFPQGAEGVKTEKGILFRLKKAPIDCVFPAAVPFAEIGFDGGRYEITLSESLPENQTEGWRTLRVDLDKIPKTAKFRFRKEGDEMQVFGGVKKSLKKLFNERKTPVEERAFLPLIAEEDGEVYAVCGVEISEKIKVDERTENVGYILLKKK